MAVLNLVESKTGKTVYYNYHLEGIELKGYLMDSSDLSDSTHTISYNGIAEIIFRQYDHMVFYMINATQNGIRYQDKIFSHDDGTRKTSRYEFLSNGDISITSTENDEQTKEQTKDEYGMD